MQEILNQISCANEDQISILLDAVLERFHEVYPQWDIGTITIRKSGNIEEEVDRTIALLERLKRLPDKQGCLKQNMQEDVDSVNIYTSKEKRIKIF